MSHFNFRRSLQAFVIFCGLGINNTMMYNQVKKTWAKQSVALDVSLLLVIDSIVSKYMTLVFLYLNINLSRDNLVCMLAVVTVCGSDRGVHNVFLFVLW